MTTSRFKPFILCILMLSLLIGYFPCQAQSEPVVVSLRPAAPIVNQAGSRFTMEIVVNATVPVYGGDVTLSFNPDRLQVIGLPAQGTLFAPGGPQFTQEPDNVAGSVQYGYSQQGNVEQVSGEGVFATVEFEIVTPGDIRISVRKAQFTTLALDENRVPLGATPQPTFKQEFVLEYTGEPGPVTSTSPTIAPPTPETPTATQAATNTATPGETSVTLIPTVSFPPEESNNASSYISILILVLAGSFISIVVIAVYIALGRRKPAHAQLTHYNQNENYSGKKHVKLYENRSYIGRERKRRVNVVIKNPAVSAVHAIIVRKNLKDYLLADLNSKNGTYILNPFTDTYEELPPNRAYRLAPGTIIRFGKSLHFTFEPLPKDTIGQTLYEDAVESFEDRLVSTETLAE